MVSCISHDAVVALLRIANSHCVICAFINLNSSNIQWILPFALNGWSYSCFTGSWWPRRSVRHWEHTSYTMRDQAQGDADDTSSQSSSEQTGLYPPSVCKILSDERHRQVTIHTEGTHHVTAVATHIRFPISEISRITFTKWRFTHVWSLHYFCFVITHLFSLCIG